MASRCHGQNPRAKIDRSLARKYFAAGGGLCALTRSIHTHSRALCLAPPSPQQHRYRPCLWHTEFLPFTVFFWATTQTQNQMPSSGTSTRWKVQRREPSYPEEVCPKIGVTLLRGSSRATDPVCGEHHSNPLLSRCIHFHHISARVEWWLAATTESEKNHHGFATTPNHKGRGGIKPTEGPHFTCFLPKTRERRCSECAAACGRCLGKERATAPRNHQRRGRGVRASVVPQRAAALLEPKAASRFSLQGHDGQLRVRVPLRCCVCNDDSDRVVGRPGPLSRSRERRRARTSQGIVLRVSSAGRPAAQCQDAAAGARRYHRCCEERRGHAQASCRVVTIVAPSWLRYVGCPNGYIGPGTATGMST